MSQNRESFDTQTRREKANRESREMLLADLLTGRINLQEFETLQKILYGDPRAPVPQGMMVARIGKNIK